MIIRRLLLSSLILGSSLSHAQVGFEEEVVLNPGFISGLVQIGNEPLGSARISTDSISREFSSIGTFTPEADNLSQAIYTLTVQVPPENESIEYFVGAGISRIFADSNFDSYRFAGQQVTVLESETTELDFDYSDAGIVLGTVSVEGGGTLFDADIRITPVGGTGSIITRSDTRTNESRNGEYRIAASPGQVQVTCDGVVTVDGTRFGLEIEPVVLTLAPNEEVVFDCVLPSPNTDTFDLIGEVNVNTDLDRRHQLFVTGPSGNPALTSMVESLDADGDYETLDLALGGYNITARTLFNNNALTLTHNEGAFDPSSNFTAETTETVVVNIDADVGFVGGDLNLLGSLDPSLITFQSIRAGEVAESNNFIRTPTRSTFTVPASARGESSVEYLLAGHTDASIQINRTRVFYSNNEQGFGERISGDARITFPFNVENVVPIISNETANQDVDVNFGEVTINFSTTDETLTLTRPRIIGACSLVDDNGSLTYSASVNGNGTGENGLNQPGSRIGSVRFYAPEGVCQTIDALATVNGSEPVFGVINDLIVEGGTIVDIDIDGPRITVESPAANSIILNDNVNVIGLVSDDVSVDRLTVNGVLATLVSTNNPDNPSEQSFSVNIPLVLGANQILIEAFDGEGNRSSNERTVFSDNLPPTVVWTPEDGAVFESQGETTLVNIVGTANDDTGVQSITLEGQSIDFELTNNSESPNEVSFLSSLNLPNGTNFLEVIVTDISGRQVMQVHRVEVVVAVDNQAPIADAGSDQVLEQQNSLGAQVSLDGSNSSDPDGDELSFIFRVNDQEFSIVNPILDLPVGVHTATLTVTDPLGLSDEDTVTITVQDTLAPVLTVPATVWVEATGTLTNVDIGVATALDAADGTVEVTNDAPSSFPLGETVVTYTATDAAGNTVTATQDVSVEDTTAPTFDIKKVRNVLFYNPHGHNNFKLSTIASNIQDLVDDTPNVEIEIIGNQRKRHSRYSRWYKNYAIASNGSKAKVWLKPEINYYSSHPGIYKIKITVTDASGNSHTEICKVKVVKKRTRSWYKKWW